MGLRFKDQSHGNCFFVTTCFHGHSRQGDIPGVYDVLARSLTFCIEKYKAALPAYVLMPSHIHLLIIIEGHKLAGFMRDFKKFVAQKGMSECGVTAGTIWQFRYDRVAITSEKTFRRKLEYIHRNPVKAGMRDKEEGWPWSSAVVYLKGECGHVPVWKDWQF